MINALSFDIEDWFQVENFKSTISYENWDSCELRVVKNTEKILRILRENKTRATFFILGWVAEKCEGLVKQIYSEGHEVASHGYSHELVYNMTEAEFANDVQRSKELLEGIIKDKVLGYRAPCFSITNESLWALDILKSTGFVYDSSIFPVSFHDRYGYAKSDGNPFIWPNGLKEVPLAVYRVLNVSLPLAGGGYFRLFPYSYFKFFLGKLNKDKKVFTFYLHPWELDPGQPKIKIPIKFRFRHYVNLKNTERQLNKLLKDFVFDKISTAHNINGHK